MCGRYSLAPKPQQLEQSLPGLTVPAQLEISYNVAPTQQAYVVTKQAPYSLQRMEWGLVPNWSKDGKNSGKLINARAENIEEKPSFRESFRQRRCLVPADSFYEWRTEPGSRKAPYRIFLDNGDLLFMAGIWDEWQQGANVKQTFSILTCLPNLEMSALHNRMPVILPSMEAQQNWLSGENTQQLLKPIPDGILSMYRVSEALNKPGYDTPTLHEPVPEPWRLF